ncbi:Fe-Mn family superoxide dismutase [Paenibacillus sp. M1]|uniref:superoxide dismutase n=1 Tax=Paenibacillus haidiansis TaxID=1574488 RepID=A0ABU7VR04_9BACL
MQFVYGPYLPVRILEEIRFWKQIEKEHTEVIKAVVPDLEPFYVKLLDEWKQVFATTQEAADQLLSYAVSSKEASCDPQLVKETERILEASVRQSREFIRQLYFMLDQSAAVKAVPVARILLLHIIRESEYFLGVLETLNRPGAIAGSMAGYGVPPYRTENEAGAGAWEDPINGQRQEAGIDRDGVQPTVHLSAVPDEQNEPDERACSDKKENAAASDPNQTDGRPVPIGGHTLPPLPYPYNALEPYIDEATMRIHHDKHHKTYVDDLNKAEKKLQESRKSGNFDLVKHWERELAFNGAGHYLHTIFWDIMSPNGGGKPEGELLEQIKRDFGSYDAFHKQFSSAAEKVEGGGWAILVWSPRAHRLEILTAEKHQNLSQWDVVPLLPLDVWEHAYYLKHQNNRKDYIADWWNVVYWPAVAERYEKARKLKWQPY